MILPPPFLHSSPPSPSLRPRRWRGPAGIEAYRAREWATCGTARGGAASGGSWSTKWRRGDLVGAPPLYVLNLVHTLELCMRYSDAIILVAAFCRDNATLDVVKDGGAAGGE